MVLQGGPEVPKWPTDCARGAKMVPQNVKMETPSLPNNNPRSQKGPAAEGVALKIRRTPVGGVRSDWKWAPCSA